MTAATTNPDQKTANGTAIERAKPPSKLDILKNYFKIWRPVLVEILPKHISPDRVVRIALNAYLNNPKLQECTPLSMLRATLQCAELGLDPSPLLGEAYFVPFLNKVQVRDGNTWKTVQQLEVQLIPGYIGIKKLAMQTGDIADAYAVVVDETEKDPVFDAATGRLIRGLYVTQGTKREIQHIQNVYVEQRKPFAAYGVVKFKDGSDPHFEFFTKSQIEAIRSRSSGYSANAAESPWTRDTEAMWKKTMLKQVLKTVPKSPEKTLASAIAADNAGDTGEAFRSELVEQYRELEETGPDPVQLAQGQSRTDELLGKLGGSVAHDADGVVVEGKRS